MNSPEKKTIVYVDALNFFGGAFQDASAQNEVSREFRWLDLRLLLEKTLPEEYQMVEIKYFTSVIRGDNESASAQSTYISALDNYIENPETNPEINVFRGKMQKGPLSGFPPLSIKGGNGKWKKNRILTWLLERRSSHGQYISIRGYKEKQSDVTLGAHMVADALRDKCDCVALLSSDSDFAGVLRLIKEIEPDKEILLVLPSNRRKANELREVASHSVAVDTKDIRLSRLPDQLKLEDKIIECPKTWRK